MLHGGKGQDKVLQRQQAALTVWNAISSLKTNSSTATEPEKDSSSPTGSGTSDGGWHDVPPDEWFAPSEGNHSADVDEQQPETGGASQNEEGNSSPAEPDGNDSEFPFVPFDGAITLPEAGN